MPFGTSNRQLALLGHRLRTGMRELILERRQFLRQAIVRVPVMKMLLCKVPVFLDLYRCNITEVDRSSAKVAKFHSLDAHSDLRSIPFLHPIQTHIYARSFVLVPCTPNPPHEKYLSSRSQRTASQPRACF